jgi:hypothetical protein
MQDPEPAPTRPQEPLHRPWIWAVYALLFGIAIPWYLPRDESLRIWLGLPHWVVISLAATLGIALFTVFVIRRFWIEEDEERGEEE